MSLSTDLPLRDFDGESDDTDSETELLIRHHNGSGGGADGHHLTNTQQQRSRHGSYSYSQYNNTHQAPSFLSQLIGVVGGTTKYSSSSLTLQSQQNLKSKQTPPPLLRSATASSLARDGQVRFRNERSRERFATQQTATGTTTSNITASQTNLNNAAQAAKFGRSTSKSYNLNSSNDTPANTGVGTNAASGSFHYSDSLQMSNMDNTQPNITTTTSPNGVMQTVVDRS